MSNRRPWHVLGLSIHLLLGIVNLAFWPIFAQVLSLPPGWRSLESMARKYTSRYCHVIRGNILLLAEDLSNDVIAARLDTPRQIVSKWRKRFALAHLPGLEAQPRGGHKARFSPSLVVQVKALAGPPGRDSFEMN